MVYDLQPNKELITLSNRISQEKGYKIISFSNPARYFGGVKSFAYEGPAEFLGYLRKAEIVLTTSFHGVIFSIIHNKPFYTIPHATRGSRMVDLLTSVDLEDRIIYKSDEVTHIDYDIDFGKSAKLLEERKVESLGFLKNALGINQ